MSKEKKWNTRTALLGAALASLGHLVATLTITLLAVGGLKLGSKLEVLSESQVDHYSGFGLIAFGLFYALYSVFKHHDCHGHEHHGPEVSAKRKKAPMLFLFLLGLTPCVAVLPVLAAASAHGNFALGLSFVSFAIGVSVAWVGATLGVLKGIQKFDHPLIEHNGDTLTGIGLALTGLILLLI
jgi:ABC-type nickel/cobalt efflux system permease component RcnA